MVKRRFPLGDTRVSWNPPSRAEDRREAGHGDPETIGKRWENKGFREKAWTANGRATLVPCAMVPCAAPFPESLRKPQPAKPLILQANSLSNYKGNLRKTAIGTTKGEISPLLEMILTSSFF